jgi:hypothetical protein
MGEVVRVDTLSHLETDAPASLWGLVSTQGNTPGPTSAGAMAVLSYRRRPRARDGRPGALGYAPPGSL